MTSGQGKQMGTLQEVHQNNKARYDSGEFNGAIKREKKVLALMRDNTTWALSQILEIRSKPPPNSDDEEEVVAKNEQDITEVKEKETVSNPEIKEDAVMSGNEEEQKQSKQAENEDNTKYASSPVQYYVNYMNEARRMDRWVEENMVRIDDEKVESLHADFIEREKREAEDKKN